MSRHAIVIGINAYANPNWNLDAPVNDALAFAKWATDEAGVPPGSLHLLLSPLGGAAIDPRATPATHRNIVRAIQAFQDGSAKDAEILYFYYAGHGLSAPGARRDGPPEPVLIPADVDSLKEQSALLLGFSDLFPGFSHSGPPQQFFFIDACRDFELEEYRPALGKTVGPWMGSSAGGAAVAQYIFYATSPGQRAAEMKLRRRGVFGAALLAALRGDPAALAWCPKNKRYEVRFSTLAESVQARVEQDATGQKVPGWEQFVQVPRAHVREGSDPVLVTFRPEDVPPVPVRVYVSPSATHKTCKVLALQYLPGGKKDVEVDRKGPPVESPEKFELPPGEYSFRAEARRHRSEPVPCSVYGPRNIDVELKSAPNAPRPARKGQGRLRLITQDDNVVLVVRDAERRVVQVSQPGRMREVESKRRPPGEPWRPLGYEFGVTLTPGIYEVQMVWPEGRVESQATEVRPGTTTELRLRAPEPQVGSTPLRMLAQANITTDAEGYLRPSESLDGVARPKLASILAYAVFAALWPTDDQFHRLRDLGVLRGVRFSAGEAHLLVLVGVGGDQPTPELTTSGFLSGGVSIARDRGGAVLDRGGFDLLDRFPTAAQRLIRVEPGAAVVELRLPGFAPTHYNLVGLVDRVGVLIASVEHSGEVAVQQYSLPLPEQARPALQYRYEPMDIRRLEAAQRYYLNGHAVPVRDLNDLLYGKWVDPLLGCLAGYSLVRVGQPDEYVGWPDPHAGPEQPEQSAFRNMLKFFDELPDSHVLAGLCEPERRAEHYAAALDRGLPVFADGLRALYDWHKEQEAPLPRLVAEAVQGLLPASPWTAWVADRPAILLREGRLDSPPFGWELVERKREQIEQTCRSVGRIRVTGSHVGEWLGTGFRVADDVVLTASFVATEFCRPKPRGGWALKPKMEAFLDHGETLRGGDADAFPITGVIGVDEQLRIALLRVATNSAAGEPSPGAVTLAARPPSSLPGRPVYVVGFSARDSRSDAGVTGRVYRDVFDVKRVLPGEVLKFDPRKGILYHDCFTLSGSGGGCVVDLETGLVLGLHYAGRYLAATQGKSNEAVALWRLVDHPLLKKARVRFAPE